jgi:ketosteroid isomerase-like protein
MTALTDTLLQLENERIRCLLEQDYAGLTKLLSPELLHTHTRGNVDSLSSYLHFVGEVVQALDVRRENLRVLALGADTAVMHGKQISRSRLRKTGHEASVEATVTQVWHRGSDGQWRLAACQATPLGDPPPPAPR